MTDLIFNTPENTPNYSTGGNLGTNTLSSIVKALGKSINDNPNQFAIGLDMIGRNLAPNNPFAGVGTAFAKSRLADKALAERKDTNKRFLDRLIAGLTEGNAPGGNQISIKMGADGKPVITTSSTLESGSLTSPPQDVDPHEFLNSIALGQGS